MLRTVNWYPFPSSYICQYRKFLFKKVFTELQHSQIGVQQDEEAYKDWLFKFDFRFSQLDLVKLVVDMSQSLGLFIVHRCMGLFIIHIPCNRMVLSNHNLIAIRAVCNQLQNFCNNTGVAILVALTMSIDSRLHKHLIGVYSTRR